MVQSDLLQEAADPATDPERLRELAWQPDQEVSRVAFRNPSLPEDVWRWGLFHAYPEAWANPMASLYLLAWMPARDVFGGTDYGRTHEEAARMATEVLLKAPERCSPEGKVLIAAKVQEWWATSGYATDMMHYLQWWAKAKGVDSLEHRKVTRVLISCVRTEPRLTDDDALALALIEKWTKKPDDGPIRKARQLIVSPAVSKTIRFTFGTYGTDLEAGDAIFDVIKFDSNRKRGAKGRELIIKRQRLLADVIRQARPLPPVVG